MDNKCSDMIILSLQIFKLLTQYLKRCQRESVNVKNQVSHLLKFR